MVLAGKFTTKNDIIQMSMGHEQFTLEHAYTSFDFDHEDPQVKQLLDLFHLPKYRQTCAEQQMDIEALAMVDLNLDNRFIEELGLQLKDIPTFRLVLTTAKALMQAKNMANITKAKKGPEPNDTPTGF
jgi:hypothetical protein